MRVVFFFYVIHLMRHGTSIFKVISERPVRISERPVILISECRAQLFAKDQSLPILNVLGLMPPARAGLELTTSKM
jgi:hypothetical protein